MKWWIHTEAAGRELYHTSPFTSDDQRSRVSIKRQDLARGLETDCDETGPLGLEHFKSKAETSSCSTHSGPQHLPLVSAE